MTSTKRKASAKIASVAIEAEDDVAKPGPKPIYGEPTKHHTIRVPDSTWGWVKSLGGAGHVLTSIHQSDKRGAFEAWFRKEIEAKDSDTLS